MSSVQATEQKNNKTPVGMPPVFCSSPLELDKAGVHDVAFAIGVFDGLHIGHRAVMEAMLEESRKRHAVPSVLTFSPHPRAILASQSSPAPLISVKQKLELLQGLGVRAVVTVPFTKELSEMAPDVFLEQWLFSGNIRIHAICTGTQWRFGKHGSGGVPLLEEKAKEHGFVCRAVPEVCINGEIVSSTAVRRALLAGNVKKAALYLGRRPSISGVVVHGYGVANSLLHCATANLDVRTGMTPFNGVYAAFAHVYKKRFPAIVNVGVSPTFENEGRERCVRVEAHLMTDGIINLYGKAMTLEFVDRIRDEKKFETSGALENQIQNDVRHVSAILAESIREADAVKSAGN